MYVWFLYLFWFVLLAFVVELNSQLDADSETHGMAFGSKHSVKLFLLIGATSGFISLQNELVGIGVLCLGTAVTLGTRRHIGTQQWKIALVILGAFEFVHVLVRLLSGEGPIVFVIISIFLWTPIAAFFGRLRLGDAAHMPNSDEIKINAAALKAAMAMGAHNPETISPELLNLYSSPERTYHNVRHISEMLSVIAPFEARCTIWPELVMAVLFHDAVYNTRSNDNEEASAELAKSELILRKVDAARAEHVARLIMSTKVHTCDKGDLEASLLVSADLAILGSNPERYVEYAEGIRREFSWVSNEDYRRERAKVLSDFLSQEKIYAVPEIGDELEAKARTNVEAELAQLRGE